MKRTALLLLAAALSSALAYRTSAQFGISPIKRPNIASIFHPVVGQGAASPMTLPTRTARKPHGNVFRGQGDGRHRTSLLDGSGP
jgi:hypothetical protein